MSKRRTSKTSGVIWVAGLLLFTHCQSPSTVTELSPQANASAQSDATANVSPVAQDASTPQSADSPLDKYMLAYRQVTQNNLKSQSQAISTTNGGLTSVIGAGANTPFAMGPAPSSPDVPSDQDDLPASPQGPPAFTQSPEFKVIIPLYRTLLNSSRSTLTQLEKLEPPPEVKSDHEIILSAEKQQIQYLEQLIPLLDMMSQGLPPDPQSIQSIQNLQALMQNSMGLHQKRQEAQSRLALLFYTEAFNGSRAAQSLTPPPLSEEAYIKALPNEDILMDSPEFLKWMNFKMSGLPEPEYPQVGSSALINLRTKYETEKETLLSLNPPDTWKNYHIWRFVTANFSLEILDALETYLKAPGDSPDFLSYNLSRPDLLMQWNEQAALKTAYASPKPTAQ